MQPAAQQVSAKVEQFAQPEAADEEAASSKDKAVDTRKAKRARSAPAESGTAQKKRPRQGEPKDTQASDPLSVLGDAPPDHPVYWMAGHKCFTKISGQHLQTTLKKSGRKDVAERILKLCVLKFKEGMTKFEVMRYRDELYKKVHSSSANVKDSLEESRAQHILRGSASSAEEMQPAAQQVSAKVEQFAQPEAAANICSCPFVCKTKRELVANRFHLSGRALTNDARRKKLDQLRKYAETLTKGTAKKRLQIFIEEQQAKTPPQHVDELVNMDAEPGVVQFAGGEKSAAVEICLQTTKPASAVAAPPSNSRDAAPRRQISHSRSTDGLEDACISRQYEMSDSGDSSCDAKDATALTGLSAAASSSDPTKNGKHTPKNFRVDKDGLFLKDSWASGQGSRYMGVTKRANGRCWVHLRIFGVPEYVGAYADEKAAAAAYKLRKLACLEAQGIDPVFEESGLGFDPPARSRASSSSAGAAYQHVNSRVHSHTQANVEKSRDLHEDMAAVAGPPSKDNVMPGNFAAQGVVRMVRACPSWRG